MKNISIFAGFISLQRCVSSVVHGYINFSVCSYLITFALMTTGEHSVENQQKVSDFKSVNFPFIQWQFFLNILASIPPTTTPITINTKFCGFTWVWLFQTSGCPAPPKQLQLPLPCSYVWMNATKLWFWRFCATQPVQNGKEITNQQLHANTKAAENPNTRSRETCKPARWCREKS